MESAHARVLHKEFNFLRKELQSVLNCIDFAPSCSLFLSRNDFFIRLMRIFKNKFNKLLKEPQPRQNSEKVVFNYSSISLSDAQKSLLVKDLKFSISPKKPNYRDYSVNFEFFYRSIYNLDSMSNENLDFVKTKIKDDKAKFEKVDTKKRFTKFHFNHEK